MRTHGPSADSCALARVQETEADVIAAEVRLAQACTSRAHEPEDFQPGLRRWENKEHAPF